ncbi:MAG: GNAT family N-acetyltransferase [Armatimonadetes bacterium]|nr:GNAT family N-acetyltransferase [Armatimonadota bacterium]
MSAVPLPCDEIREGELLLRPPRLEEAALYASWWDCPEVQWGFCAGPRSEAAIRGALPELEGEARDAGHWTEFILERRGTPIGSLWFSLWNLETRTCDLNILIGDPASRGQGVARRAIRALCRWAFQRTDLEKIRLCPREDHFPAIQCYRAAGARLGALRTDSMRWQGELVLFRELYFLRADFTPTSAE